MGQRLQLNPTYLITGSLLIITICSGMVLRSTIVSADADSVTDTVSITVPVSCTMSGNIDTAHTATINNGIYSGSSGSEYENGIGKTTLTTFCNDQNGFSVYAIGFTNDTAGNTNLAGTAASGNANIATGTATSGSTSNWAMKVNKVDNPVSGDPVTYNPENMTITSDTEGLFSSYHTVPNTYTKVAEYHTVTGSSSTDIGTNALGAKITTTYAAYISPTQPADTYTGQVKYVMVHPYDHAAPSDGVRVTYNGNGLTFPGGSSTNVVTYGRDCASEDTYYIGTNPTIVKSPNIEDDGTWDPYYIDEDVEIIEPVSFQGADRIKVVLRYGLTADTAGIMVVEGDWDGDWDNLPENYYDLYSENENLSSTETYSFNNDTATIYMMAWSAPTTDYDYGMYAEVYPIYDTEPSGTQTEVVCPIGRIAGTYAEPTGFGYWYSGNDIFLNETSIINYINQNFDILSTASLTINASDTPVMQNVTSWGNSVQEGQEVIAIDIRDHKTYNVARLADGNLWMTQNLDHDIKTDGSVIYNSITTDLPDNSTWIPSSDTKQSSIGSDISNDINRSEYEPRSYDVGTLYWDNEKSWPVTESECITAGYSFCTDLDNISSTGNSHYHLGNSHTGLL